MQLCIHGLGPNYILIVSKIIVYSFASAPFAFALWHRRFPIRMCRAVDRSMVAPAPLALVGPLGLADAGRSRVGHAPVGLAAELVAKFDTRLIVHVPTVFPLLIPPLPASFAS